MSLAGGLFEGEGKRNKEKGESLKEKVKMNSRKQ